MKKRALTGLVLSAAFSLMACSEDPPAMVAHVNYTVCVGLEGACSHNCCASQDARSLSEDADLQCQIRRGDMPESYRLDFSVESRGSSGPGLIGTELQFNSGTSQPSTLRSCGDFIIAENGNEYEADSCERLDVRGDPPDGGGCEVQIYVDSANSVVGRFQCKELNLQTLYLSTIYRGDVGWGEFTIENCEFRL